MGELWERLEAMPSQYRWAMIPVILGLIWGAYWYFLSKPLGEKIAGLEQKIAAERRTLIKHQGLPPSTIHLRHRSRRSKRNCAKRKSNCRSATKFPL